ncbi:Hypothetical cytosolic protein [Lactobacillus helveticus H10]|nr:Hypothetical cytosolic protein [Lactobacillus helveticus H10]
MPLAVFQSTHSQGVRLTYLLARELVLLISIHALTRSATIPAVKHMWSRKAFQSTHSQGVRRY